MPLEDVLEKILLQQKRIADRLEMIHNHLAKLPESNKKLDAKLEEEEVDDELDLEDEEEAPKPKAKGKPKGAPVKETKKLTEEDVRIAANKMVKACVVAAGGDKDAKKKDAAVKEGKKHVKRVLGEFEVDAIEDIPEESYKMAIRAFDRVAGTFAPAAEESDDLDI